jgi:hypothetical protein
MCKLMSHPFTEKGFILTLCGVILLILSFMPLYAFPFPSCLYWESRPFLANGGSLNQNLGFFVAGSHVELEVYVYGGDGNMSVQVMNVGLDKITKEAGVYYYGFLAFEPPQNDYYSLYLRNDYGYQQNDKQMLIKVYYYFYNYIFFILGIVVLGLGVALIISYELKSRARNRLASPPR